MLRSIRLRALAREAAAFCSTLEREQAHPEDFWNWRASEAAQGGEAAIFLAFRQDQLVGMAGIRHIEDQTADIWGVYLDPEARGTGLGRALIQATLDWAQQNGHGRVTLECNQQLTAANRLYQKLGFQPDHRLSTLPDGRGMRGWVRLGPS